MSDRLTSGPILPTLLRLAGPNMLAMVSAAAVGIAETRYVGLLGTEPLAAMAVVFPFSMLMQMFSAGSMGGGISSAVARALGAGDARRAQALASSAALIGLVLGLVFTTLFLLGGRALYSLLGARGAVLELACEYSDILFCGMVGVWLANSLVSVLRGTGDMKRPSLLILGVSLVQITLGAALGLGLGPFPRWGMTGIALGQVLAFATAAAVLLGYFASGRARLRLAVRSAPPTRTAFADILRVGGLACLSPVQSVATVLISTGLVATAGIDALAGYGIGSRLEFMLIPIAFGIGVASVPMVGLAVGRGDIARARRVAWTAAALSAALLGAIGLLVALVPRLWSGHFSEHAPVLAAADQYLRLAGPAFPFFGLGLTLFFASQGAGKVLGPVLAGTLRLAVVAALGAWLVASGAAPWTYFSLVGAGMVAYGLATALAVRGTSWVPRIPPRPQQQRAPATSG
ncbi:MAG: MATE family efflux transporter [Burkholderiales bacterium]|nr:MATE family efflux transporter [Burkholderiales bacterium]